MTRAIQTRERVPQIVRGHAAVRRRPVPAAAMPVAAAATSGSISGRDILRMLRKRMWWVIICVVFFGASAFTTTYLWRKYRPQYRAVGELGINPRQYSAADESTLLREETAGVQRYHHARRIQHRNFLTFLVERLKKKTTKAEPGQEPDNVPWYERSKGDALSRFDAALSAEVVSQASLVQVTMTDVAPSKADREALADALHEVLAAYAEQTKEIAHHSMTDEISNLEERKGQMLRRLDGIRLDIDKLELPSTSMIGQQMTRRANTLESLSQREVVTGRTLEQIDKQLKKLLDKQRAGQLHEVPEIIEWIENHPRVRKLKEDISDREQNLDTMRQYMGEKHPAVLRAAAALEAKRKQLVGVRLDIFKTQGTLLITQYQELYETKAADLLNVKEQAKKLREDLKRLQENLKRLEDLRSQERMALSYINNDERRLLFLRSRSEQYAPVWVYTWPVPPDEEDIAKPTWKWMIIGGLAAGLAVGLILAFSMELLDTSIKGPRDLTRKLDLPILGMIPHADDLEERYGQLPLAFKEHPTSPVCESHRQIRTTLLFSGPASQQRSLLITSPLPGDGRTTHALNLAHAIAHSGRRVLVVDANFRQPALRTLFPHVPQEGLSSVLVGQIDWREVATEIEPNLSVISSGPLPPNPAELLGSEQMLAAMAEMMEAYDQVLFDGGPCVVVTDPIALSTLVDGVILVVRAGSNSTGIVQRARDLLENVGAHVLGVVLNAVRIEAGGYLRKNYETFYEYRERAMLPPPDVREV